MSASIAMPREVMALDPARGAVPRLLGVGTALPSIEREQERVCPEIGAMLGLRGAEAARWERIWRGAGIERRHAVAPLEEAIGLSTAGRMRVYDRHATALAAHAARAALAEAGLRAEHVTDLVVVTCTGFSAPGVPRRLFDELGLSPRVRASQIGFMGCFGAITGLRAAAAHALADPTSVVLLVSVELCSLHLRAERDPQNLVASALFADGAAAAVVSAREALVTPGAGRAVFAHGAASRSCEAPKRGAPSVAAPVAMRVGPGRSRTVPGTTGAMSWTITDTGFAMTLTREVPEALACAVPEVVGDAREVILHPGGPAIIDAIEAALAPAQRGAIDLSRAVLRECGNMSSATILFVLDRWRRRERGAPPDSAVMMAFGPGLTIDLVDLDRAPVDIVCGP